MMARLLLVLVLAGLLYAHPAWSGGGPETTLLVVNAESPLSLAVANEYLRQRNLPERQVLWLEGVPVGESIGIREFRAHILNPIQEYLVRSGLRDEIDLIAYSAGFPYGVDFSEDLERAGREYHDRVGKVGSLTSLTFFMHRVLAMDMGYLLPRANQYFRPPRPGADGKGVRFAFTTGFRGHYSWREGTPLASGGVFNRYYLSVMLGYTGERGNSLPEIVEYLGRAAGADGSQPQGTVYLMENTNIRSRARQPLFPVVVESLRERGRAVEVIAQEQRGEDGRVPTGRTDIIGLVAGTRVFDWEASGSRMLPGAIAESFTSYGGHFSHGRQTKLTEFLRHGAAGSSGAVQEPFSFMEKFPVPELHRYYADGCSLAESFYQSVSSPYQLIVVGDPLAQPFARFAELDLLKPTTDRAWRGNVELRALVRMPPGDTLDQLELWVNGLPLARARGGEPLTLDTRTLADGFHDLRLVAVASGPIMTRSHRQWIIEVANGDRRQGLRAEQEVIAHGETVRVSGQADNARFIQLRQGSRILSQVEVRDGKWQAEVSSARLGLGPIRLQAEAHYPDGGTTRSPFLDLYVSPPVTGVMPAGTSKPQGVRALVRQSDGSEHWLVLEGVSGGRGPSEWRGLRPTFTEFQGKFEVGEPGLYELVVHARGRIRLRLDGVVIRDQDVTEDAGGIRVALPLGRGWHSFELGIDFSGRASFPRMVMAGPEPAFVLEGERVRHVPSGP